MRTWLKGTAIGLIWPVSGPNPLCPPQVLARTRGLLKVSDVSGVGLSILLLKVLEACFLVNPSDSGLAKVAFLTVMLLRCLKPTVLVLF